MASTSGISRILYAERRSPKPVRRSFKINLLEMQDTVIQAPIDSLWVWLDTYTCLCEVYGNWFPVKIDVCDMTEGNPSLQPLSRTQTQFLIHVATVECIWYHLVHPLGFLCDSYRLLPLLHHFLLSSYFLPTLSEPHSFPVSSLFLLMSF